MPRRSAYLGVVRTSPEGRMPERLVLSVPEAKDLPELQDLVRASTRLHRPWIYPPRTPEAWARYLRRSRRGETIAHVLKRRDTGAIVGVVNMSEVVRGSFSSAYLGFYAHARHARHGFMKEGLQAVIARAFTSLRLHRLEANIQPGNGASKALVKSLGFTREGFSRKYLKVGGRWRDHERWALTREMWKGRPRTPHRNQMQQTSRG
jgi:ribosomal-protein-alanine N-acetyltransferase